MVYDDRFVLEDDIPKVDFTEKVDVVQLATLDRMGTGISVCASTRFGMFTLPC